MKLNNHKHLKVRTKRDNNKIKRLNKPTKKLQNKKKLQNNVIYDLFIITIFK
jgi:hypothetical protein